MDTDAFDRLGRLFAKSGTRRGALVTLLGTVMPGAALTDAAAKGNRRGKRGSARATGARVHGENQPEVTREHVTSGPEPLAQCDGFAVLIQSDYVLTTRRFFDRQGALTKVEGSAHGTDTLINSSDPDKRIEAPFRNNFLGDPQKPQLANKGIFIKAIVPGAGAVLLEIGRLVLQRGEVVFRAGPQQLIEGDLDALCEALA
jgi:hypothetical protein